MNDDQTPRGSLRFTIWGIPTIIMPSSWLVLLILGSSGSTSDRELPAALTFVVAGMLSLLVHEFGHALAGRALGSEPEKVVISTMGGATYFPRPLTSRWRQLILVLAGPGAALLMAAVSGVLVGFILGAPREGLIFAMLSPLIDLLPMDFLPSLHSSAVTILYAQADSEFNGYMVMIFFTFSSVSIWWSLLNLLPIFPLDGGQALRLVSNNYPFTLSVGIVLSVILLILCVIHLHILAALLCALFAYRNYQCLRGMRQ